MEKVKVRKNARKRVNCEVEGCLNEATYNLYEIPENPQGVRTWLNVCGDCERRIAFNNLKRQGYDPVTGYELAFKNKGVENGKPSTS